MAVQATARLKYVSIPPRKMRLVAKLVKGLPVEKALDILNFTPKIAAHHMAKTLKSAAANALSLEGTDNLRPEDLFVKNIIVDVAPTQKRVRFQSMGRVFRYRKRFSHLTIILEEQVQPIKAAAPQATTKKAAEETAGEKKKPAKTSKKKTTTKAKAKATADDKASVAPEETGKAVKTKGKGKSDKTKAKTDTAVEAEVDTKADDTVENPPEDGK